MAIHRARFKRQSAMYRPRMANNGLWSASRYEGAASSVNMKRGVEWEIVK